MWPDQDEQLPALRLPASARGEQQAERSRVDKSDQAKVNGQIARFCQGTFDRRSPVEVELAREDENR